MKSLFPTSLLALIAGSALTSAAPAISKRATTTTTTNWIVPGANWTDTAGKRIQAHGGGLFLQDGTYYWVGEDKTGNTGQFKNGFHMYSSTDLRNWDDKGIVLAPKEGTPISSTNVGERPKIIKNPTSGEYVLWFHSEDQNYALANTGVAVSKSITGPYTFLSSFRPLGKESRDMSVFVDDDGTGYLFFATDNNLNFGIARMTKDFHNVTALVHNFTSVRYEGSGMIKRDSTYNLIVSHQSSWAPNDNLVLTSKNLSGPWSSPSNIATVGLNTYNSQNNFDLTVRGSQQTSYIYLGDRWRQDYLGESTYMWMPYVFDSSTGTSHIDRTDVWRINTSTGVIEKPTASKPINAIDAQKGTTTKSTSCTSCPSGQIVTYIGNGNSGSITFTKVATPNGSAGNVWVSVYYVNGDKYPTYRNTLVAVQGSSNAAQNLVFPPGGQTGSAGLQSVPIELNLAAGAVNNITFSNPSGYGPDISHIIVYQTNV